VNFAKWIGLFVFLIFLYILWQIRQVLLLLLVSVVLATVLGQVVQRLQRSGLSRAGAVALSATAFLVISVAFIGLVIVPFVDELQRFVLLLPAALDAIQIRLEWVQGRILGEASEEDWLLNTLLQQVQPSIGRVYQHVFIWASDLLAIVLKLILTLVLTIMLLVNPQQYRQPFIRIFPAFYRKRVDEILTHCQVDLTSWVTGTLITMLFVSVLSGLGLWVLRMPLGLASALWAGFCELIPNVGYIVAMLPPVAIALLDAPWKVLPIVGIYFMIQQIESYVVVPWIMKQQVSLPPAATLLAQIIFATFFGFLGLFLALPLMIVTKILLREVLVKDILDRWQKPEALATRRK